MIYPSWKKKSVRTTINPTGLKSESGNSLLQILTKKNNSVRTDPATIKYCCQPNFCRAIPYLSITGKIGTLPHFL